MNYFATRLAHETDAADVAEALPNPPFTLIDSRSEQAYDDAHLPGAICLRRTALDDLPAGPLVVYCWGPGCNGAVKACALLYEHGRTDVKEMLGGFEYWVREGFTVEGENADRHQPDLSGLVCSIA